MLRRLNRLDAGEGQYAEVSPFYFYPLEPEDYLEFACSHSGYGQYPLMAFVYLTHRCWDNCKGCFVSKIYSPAAQLSWDVVARLITDLAQGGVRAVKFAGRESTVSPILGRALRLCHELGMKSVLITAGANIAEHAESIAEYCTHLRLSLNTTDPDLHDRLHRPGPRALRYEQRVACLRSIISMRAHRQVVNGATFLVRPETIDDAVPFAHLCRELGFHYVRYTLLDEIEGEWKKRWPSVRMALLALDSEVFQVWMNDLAVVPPGAQWRDLPEALLDPALATRVTIHADGNVAACQEGWRGAWHEKDLAIYGNLNHQSFGEIWAGDRRRRFLSVLHKAFAAGYDSIPGCERCKYRSLNEVLRWMYWKRIVCGSTISAVFAQSEECYERSTADGYS